MRILAVMAFVFSIFVSCISGQEVGYISIEAGCDDSYPPYEFSKDSRATGFNIELLDSISKIMGFELKVTPGPWNQIRNSLENGLIDMITGMYYSIERSQDFAFSFPFITVTHSLFMNRNGEEIISFDDIDGKTVAVQQGDIMHDYLKKREMRVTIIAVENPTVALRYVQEKKADYALISKLQGEYLIRENAFSDVKSTGPSILPRDYCFAVRKGNEALLSILNEGLSIAKKTGVYDEIYSRWFIAQEINSGIFDDRYYIAAIVFLAILFSLSCVRNRSLRKKLQFKEKELRNNIDEKLILGKTADEIRKNLEERIKLEKAVSYILNKLYKTSEFNLPINITHTLKNFSACFTCEDIFIFTKDGESNYGCRFDSTIASPDKNRFIAEHSVKPSSVLYGRIEEGNVFRLNSCDFIADRVTPKDVSAGIDVPKDNLILYPLYFGSEIGGFMLIKLTHTQMAKWYDYPDELIKPLGQTIFSTIMRIDKSEKIKEANDSLEKKVYDRTRELEESLNIVKVTQQKFYESEKFLALGSLIGGISHEINTPLGNSVTIVTFLSDLIRDFMPDNIGNLIDTDGQIEQIGESLEILHENLKQIIKTVNRFKQIANDQNYEKARSFNVKEYLEDTIIAMKSQMMEKDISITLVCPDDIEIIGYPGNYYRILSNLISNSIIHGFERSSSGKIEIVVKTEDKSISIDYSDNGIGIKEEYLKRIFDPFFSTKGGSTGSGMGLNIVYNLIKRNMGGEIKCVSSIGRGTKFFITLPL